MKIAICKKIEELKNNQIFYNESLWNNKKFYYPIKN